MSRRLRWICFRRRFQSAVVFTCVPSANRSGERYFPLSSVNSLGGLNAGASFFQVSSGLPACNTSLPNIDDKGTQIERLSNSKPIDRIRCHRYSKLAMCCMGVPEFACTRHFARTMIRSSLKLEQIVFYRIGHSAIFAKILLCFEA